VASMSGGGKDDEVGGVEGSRRGLKSVKGFKDPRRENTRDLPEQNGKK